MQQALDAGISLTGPAEVYEAEEVVGQAIKGLDRDAIVLSTKKNSWDRITPKDLEKGLEASLRHLGVDYVGINHLHDVARKNYDYMVSEILPTLHELGAQGKIRFLGIAEQGRADLGHRMLPRAMVDDWWDVVMAEFNILNQSARERVLAPAMPKNTGVLAMFAGRLAPSRQERLIEVVQELIEDGQADPDEIEETDPVGFLTGVGGAASVPDAAYPFCRDEPCIRAVLSGTGNLEHLKANLESFARPPLAENVMRRLNLVFQHVDSVSGH